MSLGHTPGKYKAKGEDMTNSFIWFLRVSVKDRSTE